MGDPRMEPRFDVAIVGGGPAGTATAIVLARHGYRVALIERCGLPRARQAEALSPSAASLLDGLDLAGALDRASVFVPRTTLLHWRDHIETVEHSHGRATIIDRRVFDEALLERATSVGVEVFRPVRALQPVRGEPRWLLPLRGAKGSETITTRFFVDASGRASYLRARHLRRGAPTTALHAVYGGSMRAFDEMRVEAVARGWLWGVPCGPNRVAVVAFVDRDEAARLTASGRAALLEGLLSESALFRRCVAAQLSSPVGAGDATFAADMDPVGWTSLQVGDAALAFDPLSSQGLQNALRSALHAGACIHTLLGGGGDPSAALDFYRAVQHRGGSHHNEVCALLYAQVKQSRDTNFWHARASARAIDAPLEEAPFAGPERHQLLHLSREARIAPVAALDDGIVRWVEGLRHPRLATPVAYISGRPAGSLLSSLMRPATLETLIRRWSPAVARDDARRTLQWLIRKGVLVPVWDL